MSRLRGGREREEQAIAGLLCRHGEGWLMESLEVGSKQRCVRQNACPKQKTRGTLRDGK